MTCVRNIVAENGADCADCGNLSDSIHYIIMPGPIVLSFVMFRNY